MTPSRTAREREDDREDSFNELKSKVDRIDLRQNEVFQPALKSIQVDLKTILQMGYLTQAEADKNYVTKSDFDKLKTTVDFIKKWGGIIATAIIVGLISLGYAILQAKALQ